MKIVSWNCGGKFREKFREIKALDADIYVIEECEEPHHTRSADYQTFAQNAVWTGEKPAKGLGIFAKENIKLQKLPWPDNGLRSFLPVRVNDSFNLLGVWACRPYIKAYCDYQQVHQSAYNDAMVIIGDFNSNAIWDGQHGKRNHSFVVSELKKQGLLSAYHFLSGEEQGKEIKNTFYLYRHKDKGYHIDYCFINPCYLKSFEILTNEKWLQFSDHLPILLERKETN